MTDLTIKQENACLAFVENGGNRTQAYISAYKTENMGEASISVEACRLFKNPLIALRVLEVQEEHRLRHNVTVDSLCKELNEAKDLAKDLEQPAAMTGAIMGKAKIHGLVSEKREMTGKDGVPLMPTSIKIVHE